MIDYNKVDWTKLKKEFNKKYKIPKEYFNPTSSFRNDVGMHLILSDRSRGKTTNVLLWGLFLNKKLGIRLEYIRQYSDMITPKALNDLFSVIKHLGYIDLLTDNKYSDILYKAGYFYYVNYNENGKVIERSDIIGHTNALNKSDYLKSTYNNDTSDFLLFDEFISQSYISNEFLRFFDVVKTLIRDRQSAIIYLLSNTINKYSPYFSELEINKHVEYAERGKQYTFTTSLGSKYFFEILGESLSREKMLSNLKYFGLSSPHLASITGLDVWNTTNCKHIEDNNVSVIADNLYITIQDNLLKCRIVQNVNNEIYLYITKCTNECKNKGDILITDYKFFNNWNDGIKRIEFNVNNNLCKWIQVLYNNERICYQSNDTHSLFKELFNI